MADLRLYAMLSRLPVPRSYLGKIIAVATVGSHVPLLGVIGLRLLSDSPFRPLSVVEWTLFLGTVLGSVFTSFCMFGLLRPVDQAADALHRYLTERKLPELPQRFDDLAGRLMRDVEYALSRLDERVRELEFVATIDPLTGVYNRRAGELALTESLARSDRGLASFQLLLLDIDQFKSVNDRYGHAVGDRCLLRLVAYLRAVVRGTDWIARWGGDEFVIGVVAPAEEAPSIAERLQRSLQQMTVNLDDGSEVPVSASAGLATACPGDTVAGLYRRADEALYRAKAGGGGRCAVWSVTGRGGAARLIGAVSMTVLLVLAQSVAAGAAEKAAVLPFELLNTSLEADQPGEIVRLDRLTSAARDALRARGFSVVDDPKVDAAARKLSLHNCNGCDLDLARQEGADIAVTGWVQKVSNLILNLNVQMRNVETGVLVRAGSVDLRGNTDESWQRGLTYLFKNRLWKK